jgi:hypothetical protein
MEVRFLAAEWAAPTPFGIDCGTARRPNLLREAATAVSALPWVLPYSLVTLRCTLKPGALAQESNLLQLYGTVYPL